MATRRLFASSSCALAPPRPDKPRRPDWIPDRLAAEVALVLRTENCTSRPGKFGVESHPDMITVAKALGNGYPIGAVIMREALGEVMGYGEFTPLERGIVTG